MIEVILFLVAFGLGGAVAWVTSTTIIRLLDVLWVAAFVAFTVVASKIAAHYNTGDAQ